MHYLWEWFQEQPNPNNASIQLIEGAPGQGYRDSLLFAGFMPPQRSPQARREEGMVGPAL
jgi:hypothetical protein